MQARDAAIPQYGREACRKLTSRVSRLPRELRDIVYEYLMDRDVGQLLRRYIDARTCQYRWNRPSCHPGLPQYLNAEYLGLETMYEASQRAAEIGLRFQPQFELDVRRALALQLADVRCLDRPWHVFFREIEIRMSYHWALVAFRQTEDTQIPQNIGSAEWPAFKSYLIESLSAFVGRLEKGNTKVILYFPESFYYFDWPGQRTEERFRKVVGEVVEELKPLKTV